MSFDRLQIQFRGLDEGNDPKNLQPGTLLRAENVRMDKARRLAKRYGMREVYANDLTYSYEPLAGKRFIIGGSATTITNGNEAWTYVETANLYSRIDRPGPWNVTRRPLIDATRSVASVDTAVSGDLLVTFFTVYDATTCTAFYQLDERTTGRCVVPPTLVSSLDCYYPRVLVSGTKALFLWASSGHIYCRTLNLATFAFTGAAVSLASDAMTAASGNAFDATLGTPAGGNPTLFLAYHLQTGADSLQLRSFTVSSMASAANATVAGIGNTLYRSAVTFGNSSQRVMVSSAGTVLSGTVFLTTANATLGSQTGPVSMGSGAATIPSVFVAEDTGNTVVTGWTQTIDYSLNTQRRAVADLGTVVPATLRKTYGIVTATRPWRTSGRWYVGAVTSKGATPTGTVKAQSSVVAVELEFDASSLSSRASGPHLHVATLENHTGWFAYLFGQQSAVADADGVVWLPAAYRRRESLENTVRLSPPEPTGWNLYRLEEHGGDAYRAAPVGAGSLLAGGAPGWWDGASVMPYGFAHAPQILAVTPTANGSMANGNYSYRATYLWPDAAGMLHRSMPSPPVSAVAAAPNSSMTIEVATAGLSAKQRSAALANVANPVLIELWRTVTGASGPHYRLTIEPRSQFLLNDDSVGNVSLVDVRADSDISGSTAGDALAAQPQLYTDRGELENVPPPAFTTVRTHRGRVFGIGPDKRTVWASKDTTLDATLAPGFNEALTLTFTSDKVALESLDTALVVFGESTIDIVHGDGPDDGGNASNWQIQPVQTDVGCIEPRSVVRTPVGVMFRSVRGIELLDRGLNVTLLPGKDVVDTLSACPNTTSAVLVAEEGEVRFTCDDGSSTTVLVYDYVNKLWMTRRYQHDIGDVPRVVDAALINGTYSMLTAGGTVMRETPGAYLDSAYYVETDVVLAPISAQMGRMGWGTDNLAWQRAKDLSVMGTSHSNHNLSISFAHDYASTYSQTHTFDSDSTVTAEGPLERARVTVAKQKCQSIQIRIRDLTPTGNANGLGTGQGMTLEALSLRIAPKDGTVKTGQGEQA